MLKIASIATVIVAFTAAPILAADLPFRSEPVSPPIFSPTPVISWTGLYVGLNTGGFINNSRLTTAIYSTGLGSGGGAVIGGTAGYNWQTGSNFVFGVETDLGYRSAPGSPALPLSFGLSANARDGYLGTARARVGLSWDQILLYGTGGLAYGSTIAPDVPSIPTLGYIGVRSGNNGGTMFGWTAGAGIEYALSSNWSIKAEYLYTDLRKKTLVYVDPLSGLANGLVPTNTRMHVLKAGANYRFNWGGAPDQVVARY